MHKWLLGHRPFHFDLTDLRVVYDLVERWFAVHHRATHPVGAQIRKGRHQPRSQPLMTHHIYTESSLPGH